MNKRRYGFRLHFRSSAEPVPLFYIRASYDKLPKTKKVDTTAFRFRVRKKGLEKLLVFFCTKSACQRMNNYIQENIFDWFSCCLKRCSAWPAACQFFYSGWNLPFHNFTGRCGGRQHITSNRHIITSEEIHDVILLAFATSVNRCIFIKEYGVTGTRRVFEGSE